ncbi:MAG: hypothetical protein FWD51_05050 [Betaproteobacteria bacterium]|nr:hypothetical protein [Betaproteobacteria bacterium]
MDAKEFAKHKEGCEKCHRAGGLIMPVLCAIATKESGAPELSGQFKIDSGISFDDGGDTIYTLRLPREGFLNVFDPILKSRDRHGNVVPDPWRNFVVNELGHITPYTGWRGVPPARIDQEPPCDPFSCGMLARCISIPEPEKPRTIWIGFSDTCWTADVFKKHENKAYRDRHMRQFDVGAWWASQTHDHACSISQCKQHIAELAGANKNAFAFSTAPFNVPGAAHDVHAMLERINEARKQKGENPLFMQYPIPQSKAGELLGEMAKLGIVSQNPPASFPDTQIISAAGRVMGEKNKHKAAVVALDDPVGIVKDLAVYMDAKRAKFDQDLRKDPNKQYERKLHVASVIKALEASIKGGAKDYWEQGGYKETLKKVGKGYVKAAEFVGNTFPPFPNLALSFNPAIKKAIDELKNKGMDKTAEAIGRKADPYVTDPKFLEARANAKWKDYASRFNAAEVESVQKEFDAELSAFDKKCILPLSNAWVSWFKSKRFIASMECNHDANNLQSGLAYAKLVSLCVGASQDKLPVIEEMLAQLNADATSHEHVLSRAFMLNNDGYAAQVQAAVGKVSGEGSISEQLDIWEAALKEADSFYDEAMKNTTLMAARNQVVSSLTGQFTGAALHMMEPGIALAKIPPGLVKLGVVSQMPIIKMNVTGTATEMAGALADRYAGLVQGLDKNMARQAFEVRLRELQQSSKGQRLTVYVGVDQEKMRKALAEAKTAAGKTQAVTDNMRYSTGGKAALLQNQMDIKDFYASGAIRHNRSPGMLESYSRAGVGANAERVALPAAAGIVAGILGAAMLVNASNMLHDEMKSAGADQARLDDAKLAFGGVAMLSVYSLGEMAEKAAAMQPRLVQLAPQLFDKEKFFLKYAARGVGAVGGGMIAVMDYREFKKTYANEQQGLAAAYFVTAVAGGTVAGALGVAVIATFFGKTAIAGAALAIASGPIGWVILGIGAIAALFVMYLSDNELQAWLGNCIFGKNADKKYRSLEEEINALRAIGIHMEEETAA